MADLKNLSPEEAVNEFISIIDEKIGYGKQCILCSEDIKELMYDAKEEMFS